MLIRTFLSFRLWFQLVLTAAFLALLAWRVDLGDAFSTFADAGWYWLVPGLFVFTLSKAVHAARWRLFLGSHRNLPLAGLLGMFLVHNMVNAMLFLRAGDVMRIQAASQRYGIPRSELAATVVVVESVLDGLSFVALVLLAFALGDIPGSLKLTFWAMAGLALFGFALSVGVSLWLRGDRLAGIWPLRGLRSSWRGWIVRRLDEFATGMRALREPGLAAPAIVLSLGGWLLEAFSYWCFGQAFGLDIGFGGYVIVMITANFAVAIPVTPSGIGPYEVATQELLVQMGEARSLAAGYAIGIHLSLIVWVTITGLAAMWLLRLRPRDVFYMRQGGSDGAAPPAARGGGGLA